MSFHKELFDCSDMNGFEEEARVGGHVGERNISEKDPTVLPGRSHVGVESANDLLGLKPGFFRRYLFKGREG